MKRAISLILAVVLCASLFVIPASAETAASTIVLSGENVELSGKIQLSWTESEAAVRYYIYRADSSSGPFESLGSTRLLSYTDRTAVTGHTYYYEVIAEDGAGAEVDRSNVYSHTCRCAKILNASVDYDDNGKPIMTWDNIEGATGYRVMRANAKLQDGQYVVDGKFSVLATPASNAYTDTSAKAGSYYWYEIYAVSSLSPDADSAAFVGCMFPLYPKPQDLKCESTASGNALSWKKVDGLNTSVISGRAGGFTILRGKTADMESMEPMFEDNGDPVFVMQTLIGNPSYKDKCIHDVYYCVLGMAYNQADSSIIPTTPAYIYVPHQYTDTTVAPTCTKAGYTKHTCFCGDSYKDHEIPALGHDYKNGECTRCGAKAAKPGTPTVTLSTVTSSGKIKVSWKAVSGAAKYEVWRSTDNKTFKKLGTTTKTSYTNTSATAGTKYYYKVRAVSAEGAVGSYSKAVSKVCDLAQPVVTLSNVASSGKIKVSWAKVTNASKYEVYRATSSSGTYKKLKTTTSTSYTDTSAKAGTKYYYKVKAICSKTSDGNSAYSAVKYLVCDLAKPTAKIALSSGHPKVTWAKIDGASKYEVYRATSKSGTYTKLTTTSSASYTDKKAKAGKTYYYKVKAVCAKTTSGNSAYSSIVSIKAK